jgi:hypothetical protein
MRLDIKKSSYRRFEGGSGHSSNNGSYSTSLPARSNGLDNVDGGPDARFYIQVGVI